MWKTRFRIKPQVILRSIKQQPGAPKRSKGSRAAAGRPVRARRGDRDEHAAEVNGSARSRAVVGRGSHGRTSWGIGQVGAGAGRRHPASMVATSDLASELERERSEMVRNRGRREKEDAVCLEGWDVAASSQAVRAEPRA
jgi:hypothetical protein